MLKPEALPSVFLEYEGEWPEWFTLDFVHDLDPTVLPLPFPVPLLILGFAEEPLHRFIEELPKYTLLDEYQERLKEHEIKADFSLDIREPWGFGGVLNPYHRPGGHGLVEYAIAIPAIEKDVGECESCGGTAETDDMPCFDCMKTGRKTERDWDAITPIFATLWVLGALLDKPDKKLLAGIKTERKQFVSLGTSFDRERFFIGATFSRTLADYVRSLSNQNLPEVKAAMKDSYLQMFPRHKQFFDDFCYKARVHDNGQLVLDVPGNGCGLYVDPSSRMWDEASGAMKLYCHNVDGYHQELALLSGLAALSGMARKSLYPNK